MKIYKYIILTFALSLSLCFATANNTLPNTSSLLLDNSEMDLSLENNADEALFTEISYCEVKKSLCFKSILTIEFVQILDTQGQIVYQLPVEIAKLHLALSTFDEGAYTVNLKLEGKKELVSSEITRK